MRAWIVAVTLVLLLVGGQAAGAEMPAPKTAPEFVGRAQNAVRENRLNDAIADLTRAIELDPKQAYARELRLAIYVRKRDAAKAVAEAEALATLSGRQIVGARVNVLLDLNLHEQAVRELDTAVAAAPGDPDFLLTRSAVKWAMGRHAEAQTDALTALKLRESGPAYAALALARPPGERAAALRDLDNAERLAPELPGIPALRSRLLREGGDPAAALAAIDKGLSRAPNNRPLRDEQIRALAAAGQTAAAIKALDAIRPAESAGPNAYNRVCWTAATANLALARALRDCDKALKADPAHAEAADSRGFVLLRLGRYADAVRAYDRALELRPEQPSSLYGRGLAKLRLDRQTEAESDLAAARARSPGIDVEFAGYGVTP